MFDPKSGPIRDKHLYFNGAGHLQAIRQGDWKLFLSLPGQPGQKAKADSGSKAAKADSGKKAAKAAPSIALYNLTTDLGETKNVAADHPDIVSRLKTLAADREAEIKTNQRPAGHHAQ
jgi:arylsulfatase